MSQNSNERSKKQSKASKKRAKQNNQNNNNNASRTTMSQAPSAVGVSTISGRPSIRNSGKGCRIAHRELVLASVAGSTTFTVQNFLKLNPGLSATFPWLAPQAAQWEQYQCHRLVAEWVPIAPTSTQGDIILSPNYDASDPQPTTETQAANNFGTLTDSCWKLGKLIMDVKAMMGLGPRRYVRQSNVAGDPKTFDIGTLAVCSNNETGTSAIGKLFLDYDFEFFIPQNDPNTSTAPQQTSMFALHNAQTFTTAVAAPLAFDTLVFDPLGIGSAATGVFTPPAGVYRIDCSVEFKDSSNENFNCVVHLYKNGADLTSIVAATSNNLVIAGGNTNISLIGVVTCNGTDTFQIQVTLTGAAGTLTAEANKQALIVSLA